ncbi:hypothetical protein ARMGADRAFT_982213 [Armillaria gallica]|uniref:Uncharacterized protein n=1 Tax=Armillaria gallica TaxID=47427 RepID=A0A2H3DYF2_ARMGA|nr:hypothetical protein ARMGADRAFT_982213 [Armillaria gallica]
MLLPFFLVYPFIFLYSLWYKCVSGNWLDVTIAKIYFTGHFPRISNPRIGLFKVLGYEYRDDACHVSIVELDITLWIFPQSLRFTSGSLATVEIHDFRVRVFSSSKTPVWLQKLRRNLVFTVLNCHTVRLDDILTEIVLNDESDETRLSGYSNQWHIHNVFNQRMYTFGRLDAQLRRDWLDDHGSLAFIARECRWIKLPTLQQSESRWQYLPYRIISLFPKIYDPISTVDIYISRTDITFDHFRIRDVELFRQGATTFKLNIEKLRQRGSLESFTWDAFMDTLVRTCM